jgi:ferredoxin
MDSLFLSFLNQHDDATWLRAVDRLQNATHPVDRAATRIWFHLYPLSLDRAMANATDGREQARRLALKGQWRLADQIDSSHVFLYGHRYWPAVRRAVLAYATREAAPGSLDIAAQVQEIVDAVSGELGVERSTLTGIVAVGLRTLQQVGPEAMANAAGEIALPDSSLRLTAAQVVAARDKGTSQGLFGWLRGQKRWTITFVESDPAARFPLVDSQHITTAAGLDTRDYRAHDERCSQGPIPVQCRSCSCGTCWVGVLGGADKLSPMDAAERAKLADLGYIDTREERPPIRLACMAQAHGDVSIVIPPWNGQLGRLSRNAATDERTRSR